MQDQVRKVQYAYVKVPNKAGAGANLLGELKKAKINMLAFSGFPAGSGQCQLDVITPSTGKLKQLAKRKKWKLSPVKNAFLVTGKDRVGAVSSTLEKLHKAKINVTAVDAASAGGGRYGMIIFVRQNSFGKAARALGAK